MEWLAYYELYGDLEREAAERARAEAEAKAKADAAAQGK